MNDFMIEFLFFNLNHLFFCRETFLILTIDFYSKYSFTKTFTKITMNGKINNLESHFGSQEKEKIFFNEQLNSQWN
jgi:hypothetical protein